LRASEKHPVNSGSAPYSFPYACTMQEVFSFIQLFGSHQPWRLELDQLYEWVGLRGRNLDRNP